MKGAMGFVFVILLAIIACSVFGTAGMSKFSDTAKYAIDANMAYQQQPVVVLERQMASMQANSPSNAPGFPWSILLFALFGAGLVISSQWERIVSARTAYLKEKAKHDRANRHRPAASGQPAPLRTLTPIQPLNPYRFQPAPTPPALPAPQGDEDGEQW